MKSIIVSLFFVLSFNALSQNDSKNHYDQRLVKFDVKTVDNDQFGIIKLILTNQRVKVKYFASKDPSGKSVAERFNEWSFNKKLILVSSGTYYFYPNPNNKNKNTAKPVGVCIDNGNIINIQTDNKLDALAMVYSSGKIVVENLKNKSITVPNTNGSQITLNLSNPLDYSMFLKWAKDVSATIFQSHLFAFKGNLMVNQNANSFKDYRRFLASGINNSGEIVQYIINLPFNTTILQGSKYALDYLKVNENLKEISFLINLDTGAQNVLEVYHPKDGKTILNTNFMGKKEIKDAINLIVYYYQ